MNFKILLGLILFLFSTYTWSFVELSGDFAYSKKVYGNQRENKMVERTYGGGMAFYFLSNTALEFNYSQTEQIQTENEVLPVTGYNYSITSMQNRVTTNVYGIGLKQAFAGRNSFLTPSLSLGYARQFIEDTTDVTFTENTNGSQIFSSSDPTKARYDSVFGTFTIKIKLTKLLSLNGSVNTLFRAFEWNDAKNNLKYRAGFSWMF